MPVAVVEPWVRPEECVDFWIDTITPVKETLGINFVAGYEQRLIPASGYPVVAINPGRHEKEVHGTHTWLYTWRVNFYVMHAKATGSHLQRSREEAQFVTNLVNFIEQDKELGGRVIFSYVSDEVFGVIRPFAEVSELVLSTRLDWFATSEGRF